MQDQYQIQMVEFFHHHSGLLQQKGLLRGDPRNLHLQRNTWFYFEKENRLMFFLVRTCILSMKDKSLAGPSVISQRNPDNFLVANAKAK